MSEGNGLTQYRHRSSTAGRSDGIRSYAGPPGRERPDYGPKPREWGFVMRRRQRI